MSFIAQLKTEMGKLHGPITPAQTKQAIKDALRIAPPSVTERAAFLKTQKPEGVKLFLAAEKENSARASLTKPRNVMLGLGGASIALLALGAPILLPLAAAGGAAYVYHKHKPGVMTPERKKVYDAALKSLKDPIKLRTLADAFDKEGFTREADLLRKRAALRELPPETAKARKKVLKQALASTNVHGIEKLASAFEGEGATGAAEKLRIHAAAVRSL